MDLVDLFDRAKASSIRQYLALCKDMPPNVCGLEFGPLDWLEADVFESVAGRIVLLDEREQVVGGESSGNASFCREIDAILRDGPTNSCINGYGFDLVMPEAIRSACRLWKPDDWRNSNATAQCRVVETVTPAKGLEFHRECTGPFVVNSEGERWEDYHQILSLFWSRQTYQVDLAVYDWLNQLCANQTYESVAYEGDFADLTLGKLSAFAKKWRPWTGHRFAVERSFSDRGWKRKFEEVLGVRVDKGGRPNKSAAAVEAYFEIYPHTHLGTDVTWEKAQRSVEEQIGYPLGTSTFKRAISSDQRFRKAKTKLET